MLEIFCAIEGSAVSLGDTIKVIFFGATSGWSTTLSFSSDDTDGDDDDDEDGDEDGDDDGEKRRGGFGGTLGGAPCGMCRASLVSKEARLDALDNFEPAALIVVDSMRVDVCAILF